MNECRQLLDQNIMHYVTDDNKLMSLFREILSAHHESSKLLQGLKARLYEYIKKPAAMPRQAFTEEMSAEDSW